MIIESVGKWTRGMSSDLGYATRSFFSILFSGFGLWRRPRLITDQIHFIGNYSLVIIAVSGLFVGFVLGYQGYYTLNRFGSGESLGLLVTISLVRELGPVVAALLFAGRPVLL
jgi:phospholipid/cholesterol/gamma-HCH transport system permease protein